MFTGNVGCCQGHLAWFPVATCQPLMSLAAKHAKLQATILLPLEIRKVAPGNTVILSPKPFHQSSIVSYSTDNRSISCHRFSYGRLQWVKNHVCGCEL